MIQKTKDSRQVVQKTAWSQLLETKANRDSPFSIMVFDANLLSADMRKNVEDVAYLPGVHWIRSDNRLSGRRLFEFETRLQNCQRHGQSITAEAN